VSGTGSSVGRFGLAPPPRLMFPIVSKTCRVEDAADVAQLVEHHLAKVDVASSNLVVRSERVSTTPRGRFLLSRWSGREARQRTANPCTRVQIPSPPRAIGAAVARFPDTEEVTGSIPVSPTSKALVRGHSGSSAPPISGRAECYASQAASLTMGFLVEDLVHGLRPLAEQRAKFPAVDRSVTTVLA
jgi:hypothetical protein